MFNQWEKDKSVEEDEHTHAMMIFYFFIVPIKKKRKHTQDLGLLLVTDYQECMLEQTSSIQYQQSTFYITLVIDIGPILLWTQQL